MGFKNIQLYIEISIKACIIFFDEIDAVGGARFDDGAGGDNEVQRTMLELINQVLQTYQTWPMLNAYQS